MFTKEEMLEYIGPSKLKDLDELDTPEVPEIKFLPSLHPAIKEFLQEHLDFLNKTKKDPFRVYDDYYPSRIKYLNRVQGMFTKKEMKSFWDKLCQESVPKTLDFIILLLSIENNFNNAIRKKDYIYEKELKKGEEVIKIMDELIYALNEGEFNCFKQLNTVEGFYDIQKFLPKFKAAFSAKYEEVKKSYRNIPFDPERYPLTRKYKESNSLAIAFIRSIHAFFMKNFGKPMYSDIALISEIVFQTSYIENYIVKLVVISTALEDSPLK